MTKIKLVIFDMDGFMKKRVYEIYLNTAQEARKRIQLVKDDY